MNLETKYIIALTNLYGIVHPDKVVEIYNMQNEDNTITSIPSNIKSGLRKENIYFYNGYYVRNEIREYEEDFLLHIETQENNKFYIPKKEELLKYVDYEYIEMNEQYSALARCIAQENCIDDEYLGNFLISLRLNVVEGKNILTSFFDTFESCFESKETLIELLELLIECAGHTRLTINNGYTQIEAHGKETDEFLDVRNKLNELCKCGSKKLYKDCCLATDKEYSGYNEYLEYEKECAKPKAILDEDLPF